MTTSLKGQDLSAAMVRTVKAPGQYADLNRLNPRVADSGAKHWIQRVTIAGKRRNIGLGGYPAVSLAEAREVAAANLRVIREGRDPIAEKRQAAEEQRRLPTPTFAHAAQSVIAPRRPTWSNAKHAAQWENTLATYVHPTLGKKLASDVTSADVLTVLTPIWTTKSETASRVRQRIETVLDWAIAQGYRTDNPAGKAITKVLPRQPRVEAHHPAPPYEEVSAALERVRQSTAGVSTKLAFEFLVLNAARPGEARRATWPEVDWKSNTWTVPAARMKARRDHRVPLSERALAVLSQAQDLRVEGGDLVFPGRGERPLSDMVHTTLLRRLGIPAVSHGFRSSFKDWCIECTDTPWAVGEAALAHTLGNSTEAAYARSDLFERRRVLMKAWAEYLDTGSPEAETPTELAR